MFYIGYIHTKAEGKKRSLVLSHPHLQHAHVFTIVKDYVNNFFHFFIFKLGGSPAAGSGTSVPKSDFRGNLGKCLNMAIYQFF